MIKQLVPIRIKIGLRDNGHADHPDWNKLPMINDDSDMKKECPTGWLYDKTSGHQEESIDSPRGMQWGYLLCSQQFAVEAMSTYPALVIQLTETEFEDCFNNKVMSHLPEKKYDLDVLKGLKLELDLKKQLKQNVNELQIQIEKALDENNDEKGIKKNKDRYWVDYKVKKGFEIKK